MLGCNIELKLEVIYEDTDLGYKTVVFGGSSNHLYTFDTMYNRKALSLQPWPQAKTC